MSLVTKWLITAIDRAKLRRKWRQDRKKKLAGAHMRNRFEFGLICLLLLFVLRPAANAQTVNGTSDAAFAVGKWKESHEGVSLFCVRVTTQKEVIKGNSNGVCFLTEAQASAKDAVTMSTNTFSVTSWGDHTLTAVTEFYAGKNGDQIDKTSRDAIKFVFRLVLDFEKHQMTKFVEASTGNTVGYHLAGQ
jgi:hypothetical protein